MSGNCMETAVLSIPFCNRVRFIPMSDKIASRIRICEQLKMSRDVK